MNEIGPYLERLGLELYHDAFVAEGFDTWETLLDIKEGDLESLNVKLGHRRKLQRAIAEYRGISNDRPLGSPSQESPADSTKIGDASQSSYTKDGVQSSGQEKRKYRRHPKPDEHAPEKPPSAYVLFSNKIREEVKNENLSFTEIARLVGDRWQKLEPSQKEPFESNAGALKETYNLELLEYKKTDHYKEYVQYLADFKAKHGPNTDTKRPKLDAQQSGSSYSAASVGDGDSLTHVPSHIRGGSIGSMSVTSHGTAIPSPASSSLVTVPSLSNLNSATNRSAALSERGSPHSQFQQERRPLGQTSNQSSISEESGTMRADTQEAASRTAALSLSTPPSNTPPISQSMAPPGRTDYPHHLESYAWSQHPGMSFSSQASPISTSALTTLTTIPPATSQSELWRDRSNDFNRLGYSTPTAPPPNPGASLSIQQLLGTNHKGESNFTAGQRTLPPLRGHSPTSSRIQLGVFAPAQDGQPSESIALRPGQPKTSFSRPDSDTIGRSPDLATRQNMRFAPR